MTPCMYEKYSNDSSCTIHNPNPLYCFEDPQNAKNNICIHEGCGKNAYYNMKNETIKNYETRKNNSNRS